MTDTTAYILDETTASTPAVVRHKDGYLYAVWTGGPGVGGGTPNYRLNTLRSAALTADAAVYEKTVADDTSADALALAVHQSFLFVAWRGTDGAGRLNVMRGYPVEVDGSGNPVIETPDARWWTEDKTTLGDTSIGGPALVSYRGVLVLAWSGGGGLGGGPADRHLNVAWSSDGLTWDPHDKVVLGESSNDGPALTVITDLHGAGDHLNLAWTGLDGHLNCLTWAGGLALGPALTDPGSYFKQTLDDTSAAAPSLWPNTGDGAGLNIGWVGTGNQLVNFNGPDAVGTRFAGSTKTTSGDTSAGGLSIAPDTTYGLVAAYPATSGHGRLVLAPGGHYGPGWNGAH